MHGASKEEQALRLIGVKMVAHLKSAASGTIL